jgi:hypothetical protein
VARPDYVVRLHAAKYDWRWADGAGKAEGRRNYEAALGEAARESGLERCLLEAAVARDFWVWVKQSDLPMPPRTND